MTGVPAASTDAERDAIAALARRTDPADPGAQNNLGVLLLARGQEAEAVRAFQRAVALDPRMALARRNLATADAAAGARRLAELRARVRADGADAEAWRELAHLAGALDHAVEARAACDALEALRPDDPGPLVQRALCEQMAGDLEAAAASLERALAIAPDGVVARTLLGEILYHRGDPQRALAALDAALALAPEHADAHHVRGFVLGELGRFDEAEEAKARAMALNPALGRAQANLAAGDALPASEPQAPYRMTPDGEPLDAHLVLGAAFRQKGYLDEALREYRRALARGVPEVPVLRAMGEVHLVRGAVDEARACFDQLVALAPHDAAAHVGRGIAAHVSGQTALAVAAYEAALHLPDAAPTVRAWALANLGIARWSTGDAAGAVTAIEQAVSEDRGCVPAWLALAHVRAMRGDGHGALAACREAVRLAPARAAAWTALGALLGGTGRHADARAAYARAVDAAPADAAARYGLAFAHAALGDHDAARRETEHALALSPVVPPRALALAFDADTDVSLAVPDTRALDAVDGFAVAPDRVDGLLADLLAPAPEIVDAADAPFALAEELLAAGLYERAGAAVSRALARGGDRAAGLALLGDAFARQGLFGEALERYQDARAHDATLRRAAVGEVRMLVETGRRAAARDAASALAVRWPDDAECLALAAATGADGDGLAAAVDALARAAALATDATAWRAIAEAWHALGDPGSSAAAWRRVLASTPRAVDARLALARALAGAGDARGAAATLAALAAELPALAEARLELAALRRRTGDAAGARRLLVDVLERDAYHLDALATLGALLADEGRWDDAARAAARVLRFDGEHALALAVDGDARLARADVEGAASSWQRAVATSPVGEGAVRARRGLARLGSLGRVAARSGA